MSIDIVLFAVVAAFLVHRLRSVLGTRHGDERKRHNPFVPPEEGSNVHHLNAKSDDSILDSQAFTDEKVAKVDMEQVVDDGLIKKDEKLEQAVSDISAADASFDLHSFASGSKMAFEIILDAFAKSDLDTLKPLLSQKLYEDFSKSIKQRESKGLEMEMELHEIKSMQIVDARLAGTMVYITVDFDVEETFVTKDAKGKIVKSKSKDHKEMHDVWTFARDTRSIEPTWILIETRAA